MLTQLIDKVKAASATGSAMAIVGGGSKSFLGTDLSSLPTLEVNGLDAVVQYDPAELVIQVGAGMKITDLEKLLAKENQMLGFEPPSFEGKATIGGAIATASCGSRRPFTGAARDFVLGVDLLDGHGELLSYGGQVMKNVAGYDISRLMVGAWGCLGVITELSLKVLPLPEVEQSFVRDCKKQDALATMRVYSSRPELSAAAWFDGKLMLRFSGSESSVDKVAKHFSGEALGASFWHSIDDYSIFSGDADLWRISCATNSDLLLEESTLIDWNGGQRWIQSPEVDLWASYNDTDANITLIKTNDASKPRFKPLPKYQEKLHRQLKQVFDPKSIFNPNKLYQGI